MNPFCTLPARWDWPSAVGAFVLAFNHLDYLVFAFLKDRLPPEEFVLMQAKAFKERVRKIGQVLEHDSNCGELRARFEELGDRMETMRNLRNTIAHSYLRCDIGSEPSDPTVMLSLPKEIDLPLSQLTTSVRLEELVAQCEVLDGLILEFQRLVGFGPNGEVEVRNEKRTATASWYSQKRPQ